MEDPQRDTSLVVDGNEFRVVLISAPDEQVGLRLARGLVESGLAACVQCLGGMQSVYVWQGKVEEEREVLLIAKTHARQMEALVRWLEVEHPYDVPECVALTPAQISSAYSRWLGQNTGL